MGDSLVLECRGYSSGPGSANRHPLTWIGDANLPLRLLTAIDEMGLS
jgi:hypothetical protein